MNKIESLKVEDKDVLDLIRICLSKDYRIQLINPKEEDNESFYFKATLKNKSSLILEFSNDCIKVLSINWEKKWFIGLVNKSIFDN